MFHAVQADFLPQKSQFTSGLSTEKNIGKLNLMLRRTRKLSF